MLVKLKRLFASHNGLYDPRKRDVHDVPVSLAELPSDAVIMDGEFKGLTAKEAREKKAVPGVMPKTATPNLKD